MPRVCTICKSKQRTEIERALVAGTPMPELAALYRVSEDALLRHRANHLPASMLKSQEAKDTLHSIDVMQELQNCIERVNLLSDACDRWLRDPDDPSRYDVGPRAEDVKVSYEELSGERVIRKKAPLSELLAKIEGRFTTVTVETKHADPRELLLKSYDRLQGRLELVAKLLGELDESPTINVTLSPEWVSIRTLIVQALSPYPDARQAVAEVLSRMEANSAGH